MGVITLLFIVACRNDSVRNNTTLTGITLMATATTTETHREIPGMPYYSHQPDKSNKSFSIAN